MRDAAREFLRKTRLVRTGQFADLPAAAALPAA